MEKLESSLRPFSYWLERAFTICTASPITEMVKLESPTALASNLLGRIHLRQQRTVSLRPEAYQDPLTPTSFTVEPVDRLLADLFSTQDIQR